MAKFYELTLEMQIRRLRRTAIACAALGVTIAYQLVHYHHRAWALLVAIVTIQTVVGSLIIRSDIKRDLKYSREQKNN